MSGSRIYSRSSTQRQAGTFHKEEELHGNTKTNRIHADADADDDVVITSVVNADPTADYIKIFGNDVAADNDGGTADLGEDITVSSSVTNSVTSSFKRPFSSTSR